MLGLSHQLKINKKQTNHGLKYMFESKMRRKTENKIFKLVQIS